MALNESLLGGQEFTRPETRRALVDKFDYALNGMSRLTNQFFDSVKLQAVVFQALDPYNELELIANDLLTERWVDKAVGKQLDGVGYIVGEPRLGREDEEYRDAIRFRIFINTSNATPSDLIRGLKFLTNPDDCQYLEAYPATAMLYTDGAKVPRNIKQIMQGISPAAISDVPIMVSFAGVKPFRFGTESAIGELFVNSDRDFFTTQGADLEVTINSIGESVATFGGLAPANFELNGMEFSIAGLGDSLLAIASPEYMKVIESGYHLTGVY